jgi:galactose-1-phosphate uridylyltransferase
MGLRNPPTGSHLSEKMDFWTFHVNFYPPLLCNGRKKFMAGYELFAEVQRDFDTAVVGNLKNDLSS